MRCVLLDGARVPAAEPSADWLESDGLDGELFTCVHCDAPLVLDYDGRGTGWFHLYPGAWEGTVYCVTNERDKR